MPRNHITHGLTGTRFYKIFAGIQRRIKYKSEKNYHLYGGRGIKLFWKTFEEFRDDMYESYQSHVKIHGEINTSIERINTNGPYSQKNCKWATPKEQARNTRRNHLVKIGNEIKCITEWCEIFKLNPANVISRVHQGTSYRKALGLSNATVIRRIHK